MTTSTNPFNQIETEIDNLPEIEVLNELQDCGVELVTDARPKDVAKRILRWLQSLLD
jgi:hypothetical protein